jgi:integrase
MALSLFFCSEEFTIGGEAYPALPLFLDAATMGVHFLPTEWMIHLAVFNGRTRSPHTWRSYAFDLAQWLRFCEDRGWSWESPLEEQLAHFRNSLEKHQDKYKRTTIAKKMVVLCSFYEWAVAAGFVTSLPISFAAAIRPAPARALLAHLDQRTITHRRVLVPRTSSGTRIPRFFAMSERSQFLSHLNDRDRLIVLWALYTGAREHELCALEIDQIPPESHYRSGRLYRLPLRVTKGSVPGDLYVPTFLLDETYRYIKLFGRRDVVRAAERRGKRVTSSIFLSRYGNALKPNSLYRNFKKALAAARIPDGTFHDLRHTYAITMLDRLMLAAATPEARVRNPLLALKVLMRHASLSSTEIYLRAREMYLNDIEHDTDEIPNVAA